VDTRGAPQHRIDAGERRCSICSRSTVLTDWGVSRGVSARPVDVFDGLFRPKASNTSGSVLREALTEMVGKASSD
jgi:hypothetical protein